ncbi:hypothetical protein BGX33_007439 [Mortierella sp. NVP41]|nr:hypothetical protein BGX33_007439 [Mortierella sp. NVP41]
MAPSLQIAETPAFSNYDNARASFRSEEIGDTVMASSFLDHGLRTSFVDRIEGHPVGLQDEPNSSYNSRRLPEAAFVDSASFARLLSDPSSYPEEQGNLAYQGYPFEHSSQTARQALHRMDTYDNRDASLISRRSLRPRRSALSVPRTARIPATRSSSRLQKYYAANQEHNDQNEEDQQHHRESSVASVVARRFSDLSLTSNNSSLMVQSSSQFSEILNPFMGSSSFTFTSLSKSTLASMSTSTSVTAAAPSSSSTSVYFPPTASALHQKRRKALKQELRVPRPKNCFMLYRSRVLPMIMVELGTINNKIISKIAAERWRAESEPVKTWYRDMAKYGKEEHARNHPGYKYAPLNKMRTIATTAPNHVQQESEEAEMETVGSVMVDDDDADEDYFDGSATRRRSARQRQRALSRSTLQSQADKRHKSINSGSDRFSLNKRPRDDIDSACCPPISFSTELYSNLPSMTSGFPVAGGGLIEQQLYLNMQRRNDRTQHHQQQQQQRLSAYQAHPLAGPSCTVPFGSSSTSTAAASIYGLSADTNASEVTLVDPIDHWTTHRYQDAHSYFEHVPHAPLNVIQKTKTTSTMTPAKLMMIDPKILMEKELPPLPHEATNATKVVLPIVNHSNTNNNNSNDPNSIMSQLFLAYNPHHVHPHHRHQHTATTTTTIGSMFSTPSSAMTAAKEPQFASVGMMNMGNDSSTSLHFQLHQHQHQRQTHEPNPFQQAFQQHTQQHQQQHQSYFIKPACPTGSMSFTDAAQESMSLMDMKSSSWSNKP